MLSRVADSLYWMSRYLERAEHTARLIDVNVLQMLDQSPDAALRRWDWLLASLQLDLSAQARSDAYNLTQALTFDAASGASISACILRARDNARQVREQISSEMWEQINRLYLQVRRATMDEIWQTEPHLFFRTVKEGAHLFQGITDATLSYGEGWQFIRVGRSLERAQQTCALLDVHFRAAQSSVAFDYLEWVALLKSCTAFEAYCKVYTAEVQPDRVAEFLLLNAESPRSVRFAVDNLQAALQAIARFTGSRHAGRAERLAGRLRAALDYGQIDEIMPDIHAYLDNIQRQCAQLHTTIHQIYIAYPIEAALAG
jgi:uncharacterized alpha-E superfamily protein